MPTLPTLSKSRRTTPRRDTTSQASHPPHRRRCAISSRGLRRHRDCGGRRPSLRDVKYFEACSHGASERRRQSRRSAAVTRARRVSLGRSTRPNLSFLVTPVICSSKGLAADDGGLCARPFAVLDAAFGEILMTCEKIRWMLTYGEHYLKPEFRA